MAAVTPRAARNAGAIALAMVAALWSCGQPNSPPDAGGVRRGFVFPGGFVPPTESGGGGGSGTITAVTAGSGLTGGGSAGSVTITANLTGASCSGSNFMSALSAVGVGTCTALPTTTVTTTAPITGTGSAGSGIGLSLTTTTCAGGSAETATAANGTATCSAVVRGISPGTAISSSYASSTGLDTIGLNITATSCSAGSGVTAISSAGVATCTADVTSLAGLTGATGGLSCSTSAGASTCWSGSATGCPAGDILEDVSGGSAGWSCVAIPSGGGSAPSGTGYGHVTSSVWDTPSNALSAVTSITASGLVKSGGSQDTCAAYTPTPGVINDWNPSGVGWGGISCVYASIASDSDLTGLLAGVDGQRLRIYDVGAGHLTLNHQNTNSTTAADRLITPNAAQEIIAGDSTTGYQFVDFQYNATLARWVMGTKSGTVFSGGTFTGAINQTSSGYTTVGDIQTTGGTLQISGLSTLSGGETGINGYGATHLEWVDEWLQPELSVPSSVAVIVGPYTLAMAGTGATSTYATGVTKRPGVLVQGTGTGSVNTVAALTSPAAVNFADGNWSFEWVGGFPTLSTSSQEFQFMEGFSDTIGSTQNNGCFFAYDRGNIISGGLGPNTGHASNLEAWCNVGGSETAYLLNGSGTCDGSFAKGTVAVAALTYPNTNILHTLIKMTGSTKAEFYTVVGTTATKVCEIDTNIPTTGNLNGAGFLITKSTGTTNSVAHTDFTKLAVDLTSLRSP